MKISKIFAVLFVVSLLLPIFSGCNEKASDNKVKLDPENPTAITIWHYYNGQQQDAFNHLVAEFNDTFGKEKGIIVEGFSQGNVTDLENSVLDAANHKVGAADVPNIFAAYADTAYMVDQMGLVVDLSDYLTDDEKAEFIDSYLEEGRFTPDSGCKIFPVAKSIELFIINKTDWDKFSSATSTDVKELETIEGVTSVARKYYEWTDSLTSEANDGKAFFGRDAVANYFIVGSKQLGSEIFSVGKDGVALNFDRDVIQKIWENYYIPFVKGYFESAGRFRSDDVKTGNIISFVGSSSGATFFPKEVIVNDNESYPIDMMVLECPKFDGGEDISVQQGAGMVVTKKDEKEIYASIEFLKWFTSEQRNINFSISSGYLPVKKSANDAEKIISNSENMNDVMSSIITKAVDTVNGNTLYTTKAFKNGTKARSILEYSMTDKAVEDRKAVLAKLQSGTTYDESVSSFVSESNFNDWFESTKNKLEELIK